MFKICPTISPKYPVFGYILAILFVSNLSGQTTVNWGTHKGPASPLNDFTGWAANPTAIQKLLDISGANLVGTTGYSDLNSGTTNWSRGDRIELGFYASSLSSGSNGEPGAGDDTPSTNMFEGTWIALTSEAYIGQDWDGSTAVAAGEFAFSSDFESSQNYVVHQQGETYEIGQWDDSSNVDVSHADKVFGSSFTYDIDDVVGDLTSGTKLGIRFYDNTDREDGGNVVRYNTVMNNDWTWGSPNLYLHDPDNPDNLDPGNVFEFDNAANGGSNGDSKTGSSDVDAQSSNYVATITYWTGLADLDISGTNESTVLSGVGGVGSVTDIYQSNITGGSDNILTLNVNGAGTADNTYTYTGDIDDTGAAGGLELIKSGAGKQTLAGTLNLVSDADSVLNIHDGTLTLATDSGKTHSVEYLKGASGATLELADGDSDLITLGFANTTSYSDADFAGTVLMSGNVAHTVKVGSGTTSAFYDDEQTFSGALSADGSDTSTMVKDGVGRLRLTGDSSSDYDNAIQVDHGTLVIGDGTDSGANFDASTDFVVEKGKLEIAANQSIASNIGVVGSNTSTLKSMVGGKGTLGAVTIGSANGEIDTISPGQGIASSLSSTNSQQQVAFGNGDENASVGIFSVGNLTLNDGAVYDWEITDFDGTEGTDWDLLKYDSLTYNASDTININIFSLGSDGNGGASKGDLWSDKMTTNGFKFMTWSGGAGSAWNGAGTGELANFNINALGWQHYNHSVNSWTVYHNSGSFYLQYSAVPEPSTYVMITGLLMVPGYNFVRRFRKKKTTGVAEDCKEAS